MRVIKSFFLTLIAALLIGGLALAAVLKLGGRDLPSPAHLQAITPATKTRVLDREGRVIGEFYRENRIAVSLDDVPEELVYAFIAVEDRRFWDHWGISPPSVVRALLKNVRAGGVREGASTITQQLAKNLFLTNERTATRKIKEAVLAVRIEQNYSKEEILEMYLNQIYFGDGAYGIQSASRRFFGKNVADLSVSESAMLAGLTRNPRAYSPYRHPDRAHRRRDVVLNAMRDCGFINPEQAVEAKAESLNVAPAPLNPDNAPYFMEMVRMYLEKEYGSEMIYEGGLTVHTTLDLPLQQEAERALEDHLTQLEKDTRTKTTRATYLEHVEEEEDAGLPDYIQGAVIVVDTETGGILALAGGRSFEESNFNRAVSALRQPGSAFKPFIYLTAIREGFYPSFTVMDAPVVFEERGQKRWEPRNYDRRFHGPVTLRYALQRSLNIPTIKVQEEIGVEAVIRTAHQAGIDSRIPPYRSIALGTAEVTLEDLTFAYGTFATGGIKVEPMFLSHIEDRQGNRLKEFRPRKKEVFEARDVAVLNSMMQSVVDDGTGSGSRRMGFKLPAAGKTGTTDEYSDAWFVGYTPKVVAGVWVGYDQPHPLGRGMSGTRAALPLWTEVIKSATKDDAPEPFEIPEGVVFREVCYCEPVNPTKTDTTFTDPGSCSTGLPANDACPTTRLEMFVEGTVPAERCYLHTTAFDLRGTGRWRSFRSQQPPTPIRPGSDRDKDPER